MRIPIGATLRRLVLLLALLAGAALAAAGAQAGPLDDAKAAGLVGERPDGYVGFVAADVPLEVKQLVDEINAKRRAAYADIAAKTGTTVEAVGAVTAQKLYADARPGAYVMDANGQWVQK